MSGYFNGSGNTTAMGLSAPGAVNVVSGGVPSSQREVDAALEQLNGEIERLGKSVSELRERLAAVVTPRNELIGNEQAQPEYPFSCALANSIDSKTSYVRENRRIINSLLENLQL